MVSDKHNKIYDGLVEYLLGIYPKLYSGTEYDENKPKFPYMYFFQVDAPTRLTTLSNTEDGVNLVFQIEVYSNKGEYEARKIANDIRAYMIQDGFHCRTFMPIKTGSSVSRFVTRFDRLDV